MNTLIFDTETTGLIANRVQDLSKQPHLIEFYGQIVTDEGEITKTLEFRCKPPISIPEESSRINGIYDRHVAECKTFGEIAAQTFELFQDADALCAHNLAFDLAIMRIEFERQHIAWQPFVKRRICTVESTEHLKGYRLNLAALHTLLFDEPFTGAHSAKGDVLALTRCFLELRKRGEI